jgi:heat shock protein HtpX
MYNQISANKRRTWFLLLFFIALLWVVAYVFSKALHQPGLLFFIGIFSIAYALFGYFTGSKMALAVNGAREVDKSDNPRLWRIVENLAITDGLPMPRVYIMDDPAPNAFATGRDPNHSAVCATSGLLQIIVNDTELEGVIAHELSHIKNYDVRVNTLAFALVGVISLIADFFIHISFWGSGDDDEGGNNLFFILAIVAAILAPIAASLVQLAISRRREYLADASGALVTRYPEGLASALERIEQYGSATIRQNTSTAHMFFVNPLKNRTFLSSFVSSLFSTHPPIQERIRILREMTL